MTTRYSARQLAGAGALALAGLVTGGTAIAQEVYWSVGFGAPGVQVGLSNAPAVSYYPHTVVVQPAPVHHAYPVYSPVYAPVYPGVHTPVHGAGYGHVSGYGRGYGRPVVIAQPPVYTGWHPGHRGWHQGHGDGHGNGHAYGRIQGRGHDGDRGMGRGPAPRQEPVPAPYRGGRH